MRLRSKRRLSIQINKPWPDVATARLFLAHLARLETPESNVDWENYTHHFNNVYITW